MKSRQGGLSLLELMISVGLSMAMTLVLIQLYLQSSLAVDRQQTASRQLENAATLQHILSHSLRDALYGLQLSDSALTPGSSALTIFGDDCPGIVVNEICAAPVISWTVDTGLAFDVASHGTVPVTGVVNGSSVLQVKQSCCAGIIADQFYLSHRGGLESNPVSLYRRRLETDGTYTAGVELVEGVTEFVVSLIVPQALTTDASMEELTLAQAEQVSDWWLLRAVRVQYRVQGMEQALSGSDDASSVFSFTIASRQWQQPTNCDSCLVYDGA